MTHLVPNQRTDSALLPDHPAGGVGNLGDTPNPRPNGILDSVLHC